MKIVKSYFEKRVKDNKDLVQARKVQLGQNKQYYELSDDQYRAEFEKLSNLEATFAKKTWNDYEWVVKRNNQKKEALNKLAQVSCEVGGRAWNPDCGKLEEFYDTQDEEIERAKFNQQALFEDFKSIIKSDEEMAVIRNKYETLIRNNNYQSIGRQRNIRSRF